MHVTSESSRTLSARFSFGRLLFQFIPVIVCIVLLASSAIAQRLPKSVAASADTGVASNFVIDIISHNNAVWLASGNGLNFSRDSGHTWLIINDSSGLVSTNVSALYSSPNGRLWVATNHNAVIQENLYTLSDGVSYSDDDGTTWTQVNFGPSGLNIPFVWGGDRTIYDITGQPGSSISDDRLFFTAFAGGFLASWDGGTGWRRLYASTDDSIQYNTSTQAPSLRNLYFSCAADSSHADSLYVWAGSADGLFQYIFADSSVKLASRGVNQLTFCDVCTGASNWVFYGADRGFMRGTKTGGPYITRFTSDGLPGPTISAITEFGGTVFAGTRASTSGASTGLATSTNDGDSFTGHGALTQFIGANKVIQEFATMNGRLYAAVQEAGLYVSTDTGTTWSKVPVDLADTTLTNRRNVVNGVTALGDTLWVGTDSGLVTLFMNSTGAVDSSRFHVFPENATSGGKVIKVRIQRYGTDSLAVWTINRPLTGAGEPVITRSHDFRDTAFTSLRPGSLSRDIVFFGDSALVSGGTPGVYYGDVAGQELSVRLDIVKTRSGIVVDSFTLDTVTTMMVKGDTIFLGAQKGIAWSYNHAHTWDIARMNVDSMAPDAVLRYGSTILGITGDWFPVCAVQQVTGDSVAQIWASSRPTDEGSNGIVLGAQFPITIVDTSGNPIDTLYSRIWKTAYNNFAWNFAFHGDSVFAATDDGLLFTINKPYDSVTQFLDSSVTWTTISLVDSTGAPLTLSGTSVYAVKAIPPYLWVGTDDRIIRMNLDSLNHKIAFNKIDKKTAADEVYAFPVPFSHARDQAIDFRFVLNSATDVTIEVYDFAMNLVKRVAEDYSLAAGFYPASGYNRITWDGKNGSGDPVAVGVYYFKIILSSGETRWGKLAIIP